MPLVRQPPDLGVNQSIGVYCDKSLRLAFGPIRSIPGGLLKFPRRWLRVKRNVAFGELKAHVATCRQTVEALLARMSTAWQPMATIRNGWLDLARYFENTSPKVVSGR